METGRITEVISTTSYLPETPKTHPTDETTGINYSTEHLSPELLSPALRMTTS